VNVNESIDSHELSSDEEYVVKTTKRVARNGRSGRSGRKSGNKKGLKVNVTDVAGATADGEPSKHVDRNTKGES
jgi:hypothetical protein